MSTQPDQPISGIHHITAIASSATENLRFYEQVLGLRLVKQTVNFDDPYTYHLYYGDAQGSPGTVLTFFPWENLPGGRPGAGMVSAIAFAIERRSVDFWVRRLGGLGIRVQTGERFGEPVIRFADPDGLALELIGSGQLPPVADWRESPVPERHGIHGFHSATAIVNDLGQTRSVLTEAMALKLHRKAGPRHRYVLGQERSPGHFYDVVVDPDAKPGRSGGGTVHHIAFRAENDERQLYWQKILKDSGLAVTPVRDRKYFRSIYFHEPGGVLFEIATDTPGFTIDEAPDRLGSSLKLPGQFETLRQDIERQLPPLRGAEFKHVFLPVQPNEDDGTTLAALHGTGGDEHDLAEVGRKINPHAAVISPRGKVLERGMPRFFRRLAEGVFDQQDVIRRAQELADFLVRSAMKHDRPLEGLVAMGYSNGANIAAAVMLLRPEVFSRAILWRPMLPLANFPGPDLSGRKVLVLKGRFDSVIPAESSDRLISVLREAGARVDVLLSEAGHELTPYDLNSASRWITKEIEKQPLAVLG